MESRRSLAPLIVAPILAVFLVLGITASVAVAWWVFAPAPTIHGPKNVVLVEGYRP